MNLAEIIEGHEAQAPALISRGRVTSYGDLRDQVAMVRSGLVAAGVSPGDRVVIVIGNRRHFVLSYLAVLGAGAVAVPLHPTSPAPELARQSTAVGAVAAIVGQLAEHAWRSLRRSDVPGLRFTVYAEPVDPVGDDDRATAWPSWSLATLEDLVVAPTPIAERAASDPAVLMFTSGTAGAPRAAVLTHGNLRANIDQSRSSGDRLHPGDVVYGVLPLSHIFGLNVVLGAALEAGATVLLVQRFDPAAFVDSVRERSVTVVPGAPPLWSALAQQPGVDPSDLASIRLALTGAARTPTEAIEALRQRFGLELAEGYGLTEAAPVVTSSVGIPIRPGSVGKVVSGVELRIVDEDGNDVLLGDVGELWVRGPNVFPGYLNDPVATARVLDEDGWLHTGDLGTADDDGYVYLVDRAKDIVIVSGFNVYPAEVEEALREHPLVLDAAVIGVPHAHTGEAVRAYVVSVDGAELDEDALIAHVQRRLARYKCPDKVLVVDELPRNLSGKVLRRNLG